MYWFLSHQPYDQQEGFDVRFARLALLGYDIFPSTDERCLCELSSSSDYSEILTEPLRLVWGNKLLDIEFVNILHALQVGQFYHWKKSVPPEPDFKCNRIPTLPLSKAQVQGAHKIKDALLKDVSQAERAFVYPACVMSSRHIFDEFSFSASMSSWEAYSHSLQKQLHDSILHWRSYLSIFAVPENGQ